MIPDQSIVTYQGTWTGAQWSTYLDDITRVGANLSGRGLVIRDFKTDVSAIQELSPLPITFNIQLTVQVENGIGFGTPDDVASIINNEAYNVTGNLPSASSVPLVQVPGSSAQATGQPAQTSTSGSSVSSFSLSKWFSDLTQKGMWAFGLVAIGVVGALILITGASGTRRQAT